MRCSRHNNNTDYTSTSTTASRTVDTSEDGTSDEEEGGHPSDNKDEEHTIYKMANEKDWKRIGGQTQRRDIDPIPFTGDKKICNVIVTGKELEKMKDESGDIQYHKVFEWILPRYRKLASTDE